MGVWTAALGSLPLSALADAGGDAAEIGRLFFGMAVAAALIWAGVTAAALACARGPRPRQPRRFEPLLILGGGIAFPALALAALLALALPSVTRTSDEPRIGTLRVAVTGEQWWWRVRYVRATGETIVTANEVRLPLGERVHVMLSSDNVTHSFWIPSLAGKMDMVPGRSTHLSLEPTRLGIYRGVCAEYCGASHARMAFEVAVLDRPAFEQWLDDQARPAREPLGGSAVAGRRLFLANGCGACHTIRGTAAAGTIGPDLTHVGARLSLAGGAITNSVAHLVEWIERPSRIKPGARMPAYAAITRDDREAIARFLHGLH